MMAARAWPLGKRSGWRENRHDHPKGRARALTRPSPACRHLPGHDQDDFAPRRGANPVGTQARDDI